MNPTGQRISILRFVLIFGVVLLHVPPYVPISELEPGTFAWVKAFFQHAMFRCSVPVLTVVSGYLLFRSGLDLDYGKLVQKKVRTLLVPFLAFNLPLVAMVVLLQVQFDVSISTQLVPFDWATMLDATLGLAAPPVNYPLNFLRDLFVLALLAPLLGWLLRRAPWLGLALVLVVALENLDKELVLRTEMLVTFYLGGLAAVHRWNLQAWDRFAWPCLALFVAACAFVVETREENTVWLGMAAPLLVWPAASLLVGTRLGGWLARLSRHSFFLFLTHSVVLVVAWEAFQHLGEPVPYPLFWVATPVLATALLVGVHALGTRHLTGLFDLLLGARTAPRDALNQRPVGAAESRA
ncbi:acyltransferase family protein [Falsiroseomonas sp. E2-1-a20]|uniref:acyltransferase family protein n=1 Tax=Falsiroseomonas sp. E2-1-a20 TaxID=3239300 RepID=UPI003F39741A